MWPPYRLWDLEVVVNRALIYGLLTTLLAGIPLITEAGKQLLGEGSRAAGAAVSALFQYATHVGRGALG